MPVGDISGGTAVIHGGYPPHLKFRRSFASCGIESERFRRKSPMNCLMRLPSCSKSRTDLKTVDKLNELALWSAYPIIAALDCIARFSRLSEPAFPIAQERIGLPIDLNCQNCDICVARGRRIEPRASPETDSERLPNPDAFLQEHGRSRVPAEGTHSLRGQRY